MKISTFLTEFFFENPNNLISILNEIIQDKKSNVADMDNYDSGETLYLEIFENQFNLKRIYKLVSNLEDYKVYCDNNFATDEETRISCSGLFFQHQKHFSNNQEITWDNKLKCYCQRSQIKNLQFAN